MLEENPMKGHPERLPLKLVGDGTTPRFQDKIAGQARCLATHANPQTGERDLQVMPMLVKAFGQREPTFGVAMLTRGPGGTIAVGDPVTLLSEA
jgi:hypothetical protein